MSDALAPAGENAQPATGEVRPEYTSPELQNLAEGMDESQRLEIASKVIRDFDNDEGSRKEMLGKIAEWRRLYFQMDRPADPPFQAGQYSEESMPILAEACNQFHARAFRALFSNRMFVKSIPTGNVDTNAEERAKRIGTHMSWQLLTKDKRYKKDKDALLLSVAIDGGMYTKTYYDPFKKKNCIENVRSEDLSMLYGIGPRPLEEIERKTHIVWMTQNKTRILKATGYFVDEGKPWDGAGKTEPQKAAEQAQGVKESPERNDLPCKILEQHRTWDLDGDGIEEPYIVTVDYTGRKLLRFSPNWLMDEAGNPVDESGKPSPIKTINERFTAYEFLPNPDGPYGLGMGHLVGQINKAVNSLLRQTIDAGTLANVGNASGFIAAALGLKGTDLSLELGKFRKIEGSGDDINKGIFQFKFPGATASQVEILAALKQDGQRLASTTEALTGQTDDVQQPTTILALIDQGLQVFSTVYERITMALCSELEKVYRLNSRYLDDEEYFTVLDYEGPKRMTVKRDDYKQDMQVLPIADPKMATEQQKMAKAMSDWQFLSTNPFCMQNPRALWKASRDTAEALGIENLEQKLPAPFQGTLPRIDDQSVENYGVLLPIPQMPDVHMDQNHLDHIKQIDFFLTTPYAQMMQPMGFQMLMEHRNKHMANLYLITETSAIHALEGQGNGAGRESPVAPAPGDPGVPQGADNGVPGAGPMAPGLGLGAAPALPGTA
jgi:chaperonin GroES